MAHNLTYSTSIFESLGILSGFSISESIWDKYEKFALPRIKEATIKLRGSLYYIKDLTPKQASEELHSMRPLIPVLSKLRKALEPVVANQFSEFNTVAFDFFDTVDIVYASLQEVADVHSSYALSEPVLAKDWESKEDQHWDNY